MKNKTLNYVVYSSNPSLIHLLVNSCEWPKLSPSVKGMAMFKLFLPNVSYEFR